MFCSETIKASRPNGATNQGSPAAPVAGLMPRIPIELPRGARRMGATRPCHPEGQFCRFRSEVWSRVAHLMPRLATETARLCVGECLRGEPPPTGVYGGSEGVSPSQARSHPHGPVRARRRRSASLRPSKLRRGRDGRDRRATVPRQSVRCVSLSHLRPCQNAKISSPLSVPCRNSASTACECALAPTSHSITLSARATNVAGTVTPIALAVLRLITSSNLVGCSTGMSATLVPWKSWTICRGIISA
jgi:hypothetical protein